MPMARVHTEEPEPAPEAMPESDSRDTLTGLAQHASLISADQQENGPPIARTKEEPVRNVRQVNVPVFLTFLVKNIQETDGCFTVYGAMIQRVLYYDLAEARGEDDASHAFTMRINEVKEPADEELIVRKDAPSLLVSKGSDGNDGPELPAWGITSSFALPLKYEEVFEARPFAIGALQLFVEFTSFGDGNFEYRPDLVRHKYDKRNHIAVRDWRDSSLDEMINYDLISAAPTAEFIIDTRWRDGIGVESQFTPKVRLTWYVKANSTQAFLETVVPTIFILICQTVNTFVLDLDAGDVLANTLTIGLTVAVIVPLLRANSKFDTFSINHLFIIWLFAGVSFAMVRFDRSAIYARLAQQAIMWLALACPFKSFFRYRSLVSRIRKELPNKSDPSTFCGRPGRPKGKNTKGSDVREDWLAHFYDSAEAPDGVSWETACRKGGFIPELARTGIPLSRVRALASGISIEN